MVSSTPPTLSSALTVTVRNAFSSRPSRRTVAKPGKLNVTVYTPGRRFSMRYSPAPSVTAERTFSIRAGLVASTVTPGRMAPDVSFTVPAIVPCACATAGRSANQASIVIGPRAVACPSRARVARWCWWGIIDASSKWVAPQAMNRIAGLESAERASQYPPHIAGVKSRINASSR